MLNTILSQPEIDKMGKRMTPTHLGGRGKSRKRGFRGWRWRVRARAI